MQNRKPYYAAFLVFSCAFILIGLIWAGPQAVLSGLQTYIVSPDLLITDYMQTGSPGAALANAGLVTAITVAVLYFSKKPITGMTMVEIGLMSGFSLFGKNIANIWPILLGGLCYAKFKKEPFSNYSSVIMLATALSPMVTFVATDAGGYASLALTLGLGLVIGFTVPPMTAYTYKLQGGMNLYNTGFACGLLGMILVPIIKATGQELTPVLYWSTGNNLFFSVMMLALCSILILGGFVLAKKPVWAVWAGYRRLLRTSGRSPSDFLRLFGVEVTMVNMGINGLVGTAFILAVRGDLNGPTIGGILSIMGFSAFGKHLRNIVPIMAGVVLAGVILPMDVNTPSLQIALLFCTTLAPISGFFGWQYGVLAGFLHASVVLATGTALGGMNLYNNGFSGGLVAMVLYPVISDIGRHRKPEIQEEEFMDIFKEGKPLIMTKDYLPEKELLHKK